MRTSAARLTLLGTWLIFVSTGCARRGPDPATLGMIRAVGDKASLTIVVQPDRYRAAAETLRPLFAGVKVPGVKGLLAENDLWGALRAAVGLIGPKPVADLPEKLPGWDPSRPIVAALFEPQLGDLVLAARSVLPVSMQQVHDTGLPGVRHRVLVPAVDPAALVQALAGMLERAGLAPVPPGGLPASLSGAAVLALPGKDGFAALIPEAGRVRIEVLTDDHGPADDDDAARAAAFAALAARPVEPAAARSPSPALRLAASGEHFLACLARPWRLRDLASQIGTRKLVEAFTNVSPEMRMQLMAVGLSEVAKATLLMDRDRPELEDMAVAWDLAGGLRATAVISLTEHGEQVIRAGLAEGRPALAPVGRPLAWAWSRLDLNALLRTAGGLPALSRIKKPQEALRSIQECGPFCPIHFLLTSPFAAFRSAIDLASADLANKLPRGFSLALVGLDPAASPPVRAIAAMRFPPGFDARPIRQALDSAGLKADLKQALSLSTETVDGDELVSLSIGLEPGQGLSGAIEPGDSVLGEARVDIKRLVAALVPSGLDRQPQLAEALGRLSTWRSRSLLEDRALVGESLLSLAEGGKELAWVDPGSFGGRSWDAGAPGAPSKGERCLQQVTRSMSEAYRALAMAAPEHRNLLLARAVQETDGPLACALAEPDTAALARRTQLMTTLFLADRLAEDFHDERELMVLSKACKLGHPAACARAEAVRARPKISLAEVAGGCGQAPTWGQAAIRVKTAADARGLSERKDLRRPDGPGPALALDAAAPWAVAEQALGALAAQGLDRVALVVSDPSSGVKTIEVSRPGAKPRPGPSPELRPRFERLRVTDRAKARLALSVEPSRVLVLDEADTYPLPDRADCPADRVCVDMKALDYLLDQLGGDLVEQAEILVQVDPAVPFRDAAAVLARAACLEPQRHWWGGQQRELVVGPLPEGILHHPNAHQVDPRAGLGQGGVLAVLSKSGGANGLGGLIGPDQSALGVVGGLGVGGLGTAGTGGAVGIGGLGMKRAAGPSPKVGLGKPVILGSMSKEIIGRILRRHLPRLRYCYEKELVRKPGLKGRVEIKFVIKATGSVMSAKVTRSSLGSKPVEACLVRTLKAIRFPSATGGIVMVTYPFIFTPPKAAEGGK